MFKALQFESEWHDKGQASWTGIIPDVELAKIHSTVSGQLTHCCLAHGIWSKPRLCYRGTDRCDVDYGASFATFHHHGHDVLGHQRWSFDID